MSTTRKAELAAASKTRTAKAKLAAASRHHPEQNHDDLRRELKTAGLADHVRKAVESYPPLTAEQLQIISAALHPRADFGGGAV